MLEWPNLSIFTEFTIWSNIFDLQINDTFWCLTINTKLHGLDADCACSLPFSIDTFVRHHAKLAWLSSAWVNSWYWLSYIKNLVWNNNHVCIHSWVMIPELYWKEKRHETNPDRLNTIFNSSLQLLFVKKMTYW